MLKNKKFIIIITALAAVLLISGSVLAQANPAENGFDSNYIIGDQEILDYNSMSLVEIQQFLTVRGGYLANYKLIACTDEDVTEQRACSGGLKSAAEIIYDRSQVNKVNPKFILVLLQKEQSLVEDPDPTPGSLDWAVGYGCFDNQACNERWRGFWKQVNSAGLQFRDYMDNPQLYNYKAGVTYTISNTNRDPSTVTPVNQATAALYNYTPHVYNGNYNFYKIWQRWFTRSYPNGTLMQVEGDPVVWLLQGGMKRPFTSRGALTSRYDPSRVIKVAKSELDKYSKGAPIKFPQYSLVKSPRGTIFLIVDDTKRGFASQLAFRKNGFNPEEVIDGSWEDLNGFRDGTPITATTTKPMGELVQNKTTGGVYFVINGTKAPILDAIFLKTKFKGSRIAKATAKDLDKYKTVDPVMYEDGSLLKSSLGTGVYVIADGKKNPITSGSLFEKLGYKWENIITVSSKVLYLYPEGIAMTEESLKSVTATIDAAATAQATTTLSVN
jgi:hypothetical protein